MRTGLEVAIRKADGTTAVDLGRRGAPSLPVSAALGAVMPDGLRRGSTVTVAGSISLVLALLGSASAEGAWCALVGFPRISAESAREYGIELSRLALVPVPGASWATAVGALLDAVDVVAARPPRTGGGPAPADIRRLAARARTQDAVLVPFLGTGTWPGADLRLTAHDGRWSGIGEGTGRLRARRITVTAEGRGRASRARSTALWLPADGGGTHTVLTSAPAPVLAEPTLVELAG
ncbi:MAG: hypothetical protein M3O28_08610 [Actinomycetota bacterium]|nr:hypothetical protein [Actinomycetota bacterium]